MFISVEGIIPLFAIRIFLLLALPQCGSGIIFQECYLPQRLIELYILGTPLLPQVISIFLNNPILGFFYCFFFHTPKRAGFKFEGMSSTVNSAIQPQIKRLKCNMQCDDGESHGKFNVFLKTRF